MGVKLAEAGRSPDLLEAATKALPILAVFLPVSGVLVRWVAFVTGGIPVQNPLYLALGSPLNELVATGALTWVLVIVALPMFVLLRYQRESELWMKSAIPFGAKLDEFQHDLTTDLDDLRKQRERLNEQSAESSANAAALIAAYEELSRQTQNFGESADQRLATLKAEADVLSAEAERLHLPRLRKLIFLRGSRRFNRTMQGAMLLILLAFLVVFPNFPLAFLIAFGVLGSYGLAVWLTHRRRVTWFRILPSMFLLELMFAIASGVNGNVLAPIGTYSFSKGAVGVLDSRYVEVANWGDSIALVRCGDRSGDVILVAKGVVVAIELAPSSPVKDEPSLLSILEGAHPVFGSQFC